MAGSANGVTPSIGFRHVVHGTKNFLFDSLVDIRAEWSQPEPSMIL